MNDFYNAQQNVILTDRSVITVTGIKSVDSFDDTAIVATTVNDTVIVIEGTNLTVKDVNLDKAQIEASGNVSAFFYEDKQTSRRDLLGFLFRKK